MRLRYGVLGVRPGPFGPDPIGGGHAAVFDGWTSTIEAAEAQRDWYQKEYPGIRFFLIDRDVPFPYPSATDRR